MKRFATLFAVLASLVAPTGVWAHGASDMLISSTADGGGALKAEYDFSAVSRLSFSASLPGPVSVYTGVEPAFDLLAADEPLESSYVLDNGTQVRVEITGIDAGKTAIKINSTVLSAVGDSVVFGTTPIPHNHPELQLLLTLPEGEFGEGAISFKLTAPSSPYGESEIYTLKLSNGPLAPLDYDTGAYANKSVLCQQTVGAQVRTLINKELGYLKACLDKVAVATAKAALTTPPPSLAAAQAAAEKACADAAGTGSDTATMLGKLAKAKAAASTAIKKRCGTPNPPAVPNSASGDLSDDDVSQHLGLAGCRAEELAAATYGGAKKALAAFNARASQGGNPLDQYFPCLVETAAP